MTTRHKLRMAFITIVLLPTSCLAGNSASNMLAGRSDAGRVTAPPQAYENILWLAALALMLVWAWAMNRLWQSRNP